MIEEVTPRRQLFHETAEYRERMNQAEGVDIPQDTTTSEVPIVVGAVAVGGAETAEEEMEEYELPPEPTEKQRATLRAADWRMGDPLSPRYRPSLGAWATRFGER